MTTTATDSSTTPSRPSAAQRRLAEALGLQPHYEALDRVLAEDFAVGRWLNCLAGDEGELVVVAQGGPGERPPARVVAVAGEAPADGLAPLAGLRMDELAPEPFAPPAAAAPYRLAVPYRFRHRTFGLLLLTPEDEAGFAADTIARLATFAEERLAPLTFREHTIDQVFRDRSLFTAQLDYLVEMGRLAANLDLKVLLNKIMELTMQFAGAEVGSLVLLEDDQPVTRLDWGLPHEALMALTGPGGEPLLIDAIGRPEPRWFGHGEFTVPAHLPYRFQSLALLPLRTRDTWLGAVCLVASTADPEFHAGKLDGLDAGLSLAATAVENARLFQVKAERERELRNMEIAGEIQKALLPRAIPDLQGISVVGTNVAARTIGGDYYDFFPFADGSLGLIVADVAGKGVAASLIMTSTRMLVRSIAADGVAVEEVIRRTNAMLQAEACGGQFVTANYVRVDPRRMELQVCTAGHEPVLIYRPGEDRFLAAQSRALPLGITPDAVYTRETIPLEPGDLILLYTDGVNEAMSREREQFGLTRLQDTVRSAWPDGIESIMNTVLTAVDWHGAGMPRHDDTTIVVAQVTAGDHTGRRGGVVGDDNGQR